MVNLNLGYELVPNILWMEVKCLMPRAGYTEPQVLCFVGRAPCVKHIEDANPAIGAPARYRFEPMPDKMPRWIIPDGFIPGSFYLEGWTQERGGESRFQWDLAGQENFRPGDPLYPGVCRAPIG